MSSSAGSSRNTNTDPTKTLCRYFMNGACQLGSNCQFSHDRSDRPSMVCRYYVQGACSYGNHCRYDHVRPSKRSQENAQRHETSTSAAEVERKSSEVTLPPAAKDEANIWATRRNGFHIADGDDDLGLVSLRDANEKIAIANSSKLRADAKEFVPSFAAQVKSPSPPSYARAVAATSAETNGVQSAGNKDLLCPYHIMGQCNQGDACLFTHGVMCDLCNRPVLHPENQTLSAQHRQECMAECEREMELAFALARGDGKQCGICFEVIMEKANPTSRRFGVLPCCKHCFCLDCIRKWRRAEQFENKVIRACPECRVKSDFVIPSTVWVEEEDEKRALLDAYQASMKQKVCKYFRNGQTECPFGNKCFYRHVEPDGSVVAGDSPRTIRRRQERLRRAREGEGPSADVFVLWDFLEQRHSNRGGRTDDSDDDEFDMMIEFLIDGRLDVLRLSNASDSDSTD